MSSTEYNSLGSSLENAAAADPSQRQVLSVSQLTASIKQTLESRFTALWVCGEVSDVARPRSGHVYFTLKDGQAQIRAVMWRSTVSRLRFDLEDGTEVVCRANLDVYPPRGSYQLVVRQVEPRGMGALQLALQQLQRRLAAAGLFDPQHKQPLPRFPQQIAMITSPTGAAIRDFLEALRSRWQGGDVLVLPSRVQGTGAGEEIAQGIRTANQLRPSPDVLVVGRGGGSLEDLWCFNEEAVVQAIFDSRVPVVSAVGHEIDVTLADLVADARALTPTAAAELVAPAKDELQVALRTMHHRLNTSLQSRAVAARAQLESLGQRRVLRRPLDRVRESMRRLDELEMRAVRATRGRHTRFREQLGSLAARLESLSPLAVLGRGYTLTQRTKDRQLIDDAATLVVGEELTTRFAKGWAVSRVERLGEDDDLERSASAGSRAEKAAGHDQSSMGGEL